MFWDRSRLVVAHALQVTGLPGLVIESLLRTVEPKQHEEALVRQRLDPVPARARGSGAEVDVRGAICVLARLVHRVDRGERLAVVHARGSHCVIDGHGPEELGWGA